MIKLIRRSLIVVFVLYLALFGLTKAIRYPEPIAAIKLGLAPASKTPDLMPFHNIVAAPSTYAPWKNGNSETVQNVTYEGKKITFDEFLEKTKTNAFIIVRDGKITYETYLNGKKQNTILPSYSVAKTMTSLIIGQLVEEGKIKESDKFVSILPKFKAGTTFDDVTIKDLLDMNSGIGVSDNYPAGPSGWGVAIAQLYASTDVNWWLEQNKKMREVPGTFPEYRSVNTQMLGMIIQKVTGRTLSEEFTDRVWQKVGADYDATWNVDSEGGYEKAFCCFNATARDYARIGQALITQQGEKNPNAITSQAWLKRLSTPTVTLDYDWGYAAQMWHPFPGINLMLGLHGQYIYQDKANKTVIVKLSDIPTSEDDLAPQIAAVLKQIAEKNY